MSCEILGFHCGLPEFFRLNQPNLRNNPGDGGVEEYQSSIFQIWLCHSLRPEDKLICDVNSFCKNDLSAWNEYASNQNDIET